MNGTIKHTLLLTTALLLAPLGLLHATDTLIVENGQPRAEIVISASPTRMQRVAAH